MSVIHLDSDFFVEDGEVIVMRKEISCNVTHGAGHKEVLLHQAEFFAGHHGIAWIEHARDVLTANLCSTARM